MVKIKAGFLGRRKGIETAKWCTENPTLPVVNIKTVANKYRKEHKSHYLRKQQK